MTPPSPEQTAAAVERLKHLKKWKSVLKMLINKHPGGNCAVWVAGYIYGLESK